MTTSPKLATVPELTDEILLARFELDFGFDNFVKIGRYIAQFELTRWFVVKAKFKVVEIKK